MDFGEKRIGLAHGDSKLGLPTPLPNLAASGTLKKDADSIAEIATKINADRIVVGFPEWGEPGDGGRMQRACQKIADILNQRGCLTVLMNESFSSEEAIEHLRSLEQSRKKISVRKDGTAAAIILERYFNLLEVGN